MKFRELMDTKYKEILEHYLNEQDEKALYLGQKFSRKSIEHNVSPEEIISLHKSVILEMEPDLPHHVLHSFDILLEVMIGYGFAYREHQSLRTKQQELNNEIDVAANMQQTLLGTRIPEVDGLEVGAVSVPAKKMNGDYYHFVEDENENVSVAIADVIGKGVPAALCMSMIKYAMDSLPEYRHKPSLVLESLNRVVEQNVDASMFITMFYGVYDSKSHVFSYSSAGHEPGFYYNAINGEFEDLDAKGLLLGVDKKAKYREYERGVEEGDMIILLSDGVTECRSEEGFIEREDLVELIRKYNHLPPQEIVNSVYKELEKLQHFELRDDFTLIIIKRNQ
ncbi:PP2C family protein-serine/threonine phosphatase [Rossellomorea marisflavi]|uniref:Phosphoserine phosphatase n=1 Tax=Rossellomorea marisflavi TaxID=189381 RepID=A0A0J5UXM9_9BACI|nr:PP2C family protein-serine/threonine phosphatase [Rossellomorea marisflavi]KMK91561.1 phosphoserine phosphatase [Rossellomorea marisflavi]KML01911.1 phosphoserine phosphatase [Rossellomorea marisflavi]KML28526.1 phosphoserine phosphatase [Rossellomorea marisflavi]KZE50090.1 phosphoserine phosphatase [Rossellomorea marisflavi]MCM2604668.1 PP2C family protein-serine/threonine phosphatase [Rossellomorea marisflavi]